MHRATLYVGAACLVATTAAPVAAQGFDGVMKFAVRQETGGAADTLTQFTMGSKIRFEGMGSGGALISDGDKWFTLIPGTKHYMIVPAIKQEGAELGRQNGTAVKTGKMETVAGISCEVWHFTGMKDTQTAESGDACLAKGAGLMVGRMTVNDMGRQFDAAGIAYNQARSSGMGVMKVTTNGRVVLETIKAEVKSVSDETFKAPPGYTAITTAQLFKLH
jgi:hypothetical protein